MLSDITQKLLAAKKEMGITFTDLEKVLGRDEVWIAAVFYRQASASPEEAEKILSTLKLPSSLAMELTECPLKGDSSIVPTDPLIYRFYEIMQVYGMPLKSVIHEKFGDGIMSAINANVDIQRKSDPEVSVICYY